MTQDSNINNTRDKAPEKVGEVVRRKKGGAKPGAGRPKGRMNQSTLDAMAVKKKYQDRIRKSADRLFNAQMNLAEGSTLLFRIEKDDKGKNMKPQQVTDQNEIMQFIDECGGYEGTMNGDTYYFVTTKLPDSRTITDMLDRAMGKPDATLDLSNKDGTLRPYEGMTKEQILAALEKSK